MSSLKSMSGTPALDLLSATHPAKVWPSARKEPPQLRKRKHAI